MKTTIFIAAIATLTTFSLAGDISINPSNQAPEKIRFQSFEPAIQECRQLVEKDESSRPNMSQMEQCMGTKGFAQAPIKTPKNGDINQLLKNQ